MVSIEHSIFKSLLFNEEYVRKVVPYLDEKFFDDYHKTLFGIYKVLFDKYNSVPTYEALAISLQKCELGESEFNNIIEFVSECVDTKDELPDTDWLVDETEQYCQDKAVYDAVYKSINILDGNDKKLDKHAIPEMMEDALSISFGQSIGMDMFEDAEKRYEAYIADDNRIPFTIEALNKLSNGGLKNKGSLSAFLASTNVGKSALMCFIAGELLKAGHDILYISLEMDEESIYERVEANLMNVKTDDLKKLTKEEYLGKINSIKNKTNGRFFAKQYPTSAAHAGHFRHLVKELKQKKKFTPAVVFVDYINICASSRYKSLSGVNSYSYIKAIAEEIRGLAVEMDCPFVTATQTNRDGFKEKPDMTSTSESMGLPHSLDWFVSIYTDEVLQENNQQILTTLKTRWGNKSKIKPQIVGVEWDNMRYYDVGSTEEVKAKVGNNKPGRKVKDADQTKQDKKKENLEKIDFGD